MRYYVYASALISTLSGCGEMVRCSAPRNNDGSSLWRKLSQYVDRGGSKAGCFVVEYRLLFRCFFLAGLAFGCCTLFILPFEAPPHREPGWLRPLLSYAVAPICVAGGLLATLESWRRVCVDENSIELTSLLGKPRRYMHSEVLAFHPGLGKTAYARSKDFRRLLFTDGYRMTIFSEFARNVELLDQLALKCGWSTD